MPKTPSKSTKSKPLSKRAQWDGFERQVRALALELGIPETLYDLSKVRKKPGAGSEAWKGHERQFTELLVNAGFAAQDRKSTRLNSSHIPLSRMPSSA